MAEDVFALTDTLGPAKIIHVSEPSVGLRGTLVIDNVAAGLAIGGVRIAADVNTEECVRLARAMTLKSAAAGLPHGGAKAVIYGDAKMLATQKQILMRAFAAALRYERDCILGPDIGTDETCMAWVKDEIGRSVGLPREIGGIPLDEIGATGWGLLHATESARHFCPLKLEDARVVVQGFGAVGSHVARFLVENGAILVGVSDSQGAVYCSFGFNVGELVALKRAGKSVIDHPDGQKMERDDLVDVPCDIWIPAARPDFIHAGNVDRLRTRMVIQGANIPVTPEAEEILQAKGIVCVPDFIANAGGLICAAMEYQGATEVATMLAIKEKIRRNTEKIMEIATKEKILPRKAAMQLAMKRLTKAMSYRRWSIFAAAGAA